MIILPRRKLLLGLSAFFAAPAIVHAENIMRVRVMRGPTLEVFTFSGINGDEATSEIIDCYDTRYLDVIAGRILAAHIVVVR